MDDYRQTSNIDIGDRKILIILLRASIHAFITLNGKVCTIVDTNVVKLHKPVLLGDSIEVCRIIVIGI